MTYQHITYSLDDSTATITLNRPHKLNAFTIPMGEEILNAIDETDEDDQVRAVVFTGEGTAFCAGADLSSGTEIFSRDEVDNFDMARDADFGGRISRRLLASKKPLIAAINGAAVGIGATMTLPMDVRMASTTARAGFVFGRVGIVPEACSTWFLPRIVGISQAAEWIFSGRVFGADEALRAGLVSSVHEPAELLPAAYELARSFASTAPVATAIARRMLWDQLRDGTPELAHELDSRGLFFLGRSQDAEEGIAAFSQKRAPRFPMRVSTDMPAYFDVWTARGSARQAFGMNVELP